jgi:2-(1,2-epoxy-1,2-dihydrophenyl)acetyl-CoA isomerase
MESPISIDQRDGILDIVLNRPERKNAITNDMMVTLSTAFERVKDQEDVRVILLRAAGKDFSSGGDIKDIAPVLEQAPAKRSSEFRSIAREAPVRLFTAMYRTPQPVLVSVRGHVIGAAVQMVAIADLVIASESARFCIPQINLAHTVDHGESWHLPRKIGLARALQMCLLAEQVGAAEAARIGLINWVVPDSELDARSDEIVRRIALSPPVAARGMKALLRTSETNNVEQQHEAEIEMIGRAVATEDFVEAIRGFIEKRTPVFTGR